MTQLEKIQACIKDVADSMSTFDDYATPKGSKSLRKTIAGYLGEKLCTEVSTDNLFITSGSQQSIDLLARLLINPGDTIISEEPTYFGAIGSFGMQKANVSTIGISDNGVNLDDLKQNIKKNDPKLIYVVPTFNNPTGISWSNDQRQEFLEIANDYDIPIIEDDPYSEFNYTGKEFNPLYRLDKTSSVVYLGTFSKIIGPGINVGYILAKQSIINALYEKKIFADMHTSPFSQAFIDNYLKNYDIKSDIVKKQKKYQKQFTLTKNSLSRTHPEIRLSNTEGGLYMAAFLPNDVETDIYTTNYFDSTSQNLHRVNIKDPIEKTIEGLESALVGNGRL